MERCRIDYTSKGFKLTKSAIAEAVKTACFKPCCTPKSSPRDIVEFLASPVTGIKFSTNSYGKPQATCNGFVWCFNNTEGLPLVNELSSFITNLPSLFEVNSDIDEF